MTVSKSGKVAKSVAYVALALAVVFVVFVGTASLFSWYPTVGRSMEPTLPRFGGFIRTVPPSADNIQPGKMIRFVSPNDELCVKRIEKVSEDGRVWVSADNKGWTGEDSDQYGWVNTSSIIGVVEDVWSLTRAIRSVSEIGRFVNDLELRHGRKPDHTFGLVKVDGSLAQEMYALQPQIEEGITVKYTDNCAVTVTAENIQLEINQNGTTRRCRGNFHLAVLVVEHKNKYKVVEATTQPQKARSPLLWDASRWPPS